MTAKRTAWEHTLGRLTPEETASLLEALQRMGFYDPDLPHLLEGLRDVTLKPYPKGHVLMREGEPAKEFYIIHEGRVAVTRARKPGKRERRLPLNEGRTAVPAPGPDGTQKVAELGQYAVVGEMALVEERPRSSTVTVLEDSRLFRLTKRDFQFLMQTCDVFRQVIETLVAERNRYNALLPAD